MTWRSLRPFPCTMRMDHLRAVDVAGAQPNDLARAQPAAIAERQHDVHLEIARHDEQALGLLMTGVRFLFRVTLRRHDLASEVYHLKEPQKLPLVISALSTRYRP